LNQKTITQNTYDKIKNFVEDESFWEKVTVRKSLQKKTKEAIQNVVQSQPPIEKDVTNKSPTLLSKTKYPVQLAREFILKNPVERTRVTYKSKLNVLMKLLCKKNEDNFMCIYKKESIPLIKKEYKAIANQYINFMLYMIDNVDEIKNRVAKNLVDLLRKEAKITGSTATSTTIRTNEERKKNTDYTEKYDNMINKDTSKLTDIEKLIRSVYINGIYDTTNTLRLIPRNYLYSAKIIKNLRENDKINNFYIERTGTLVINDFKTKTGYEPIMYKIATHVKELISQSLKKNPREYLFGQYKRDSFNLKISKSLGTGIDDYRRIMKDYHHLKKPEYTLEYIADVMRNSPTSGKISY